MRPAKIGCSCGHQHVLLDDLLLKHPDLSSVLSYRRRLDRSVPRAIMCPGSDSNYAILQGMTTSLPASPAQTLLPDLISSWRNGPPSPALIRQDTGVHTG
jgi:hypothetical protein